jgi:hypothetical protein
MRDTKTKRDLQSQYPQAPWTSLTTEDVVYLQALVLDITQTDLLDKSAAETISGAWTFSGGVTLTDLTALQVVSADASKKLISSGVTTANLVSLTDDSMVDALHRHSELSASDGSPDQALVVDTDGKIRINWAAPVASARLYVRDTTGTWCIFCAGKMSVNNTFSVANKLLDVSSSWSNTGAIATATNYNAVVTKVSSGNITFWTALLSEIKSTAAASGTISHAAGQKTLITVAAGSSVVLTNVYGNQLTANVLGGTVTNIFGMHMADMSAVSTNSYGLHLNTAAAANHWNIYCAGTAANYMAGNLGIGVPTPTARLHLPAGTAAASTAPLKFNAGTLLTTPEAGVMEFDGTGIYLTNTNHRRFISQASDSIIATVTATTVASTTLWTGITNANELKAYRVYNVKGCGLINNVSAAGVVTVTVNFGATAIITFVSPSAKLTNDPYHFEVVVTVRTTGAAGTVSAFGELTVDATTGSKTTHVVTESIAVDTTIANNITVKATWSAANAANWLKLTQCWLAFAD